jgi:hypothetical protein
MSASVNVTDSAKGSPQSIALAGTGVVSGPNTTLSVTSLSFGTQLVGTGSAAQQLTLANYGSQALAIGGISASGDFTQSNTCGSALDSAQSCTISVTFTPSQGGTRSGLLSLADNAPSSPQTIPLSGVATVVSLNPSILEFQGNQQKSTTLTNKGSVPLHISAITLSGSAFQEGNDCRSSVAAGGSCTIGVTYFPQGSSGSSGTVSINDDGGASPQQVTLSGCPVCAPRCPTGSICACGKCIPFPASVSGVAPACR